MKKLQKLSFVVLLLITPLFYSCESLTGSFDEISTLNDTELFTQETGGTEDGGEVGADGKPPK